MTDPLPAAQSDAVASLRERKKRQTRATIAATATDLFSRHGFESVTVEQVARAAGVSRQTIFNYFATKEEMLFDRDHEVLAALLDAIANRGERSLVDVFRAHTIAFWERIGAAAAPATRPHAASATRAPAAPAIGAPGAPAIGAAEFWTVVRPSPALRDHAEVVFARHARAVAAALAGERGLPEDDPSCHVAARVLCAVNAAVLTCGLGRLAKGAAPAAVAEEMIVEAHSAYDLIEPGMR